MFPLFLSTRVTEVLEFPRTRTRESSVPASSWLFYFFLNFSFLFFSNKWLKQINKYILYGTSLRHPSSSTLHARKQTTIAPNYCTFFCRAFLFCFSGILGHASFGDFRCMIPCSRISFQLLCFCFLFLKNFFKNVFKKCCFWHRLLLRHAGFGNIKRLRNFLPFSHYLWIWLSFIHLFHE